MNTMDNIITTKNMFRQKRNLEAESRRLHSHLEDKRFSGAKLNEAIRHVDKQLFRIHTRLVLLNEDEALVIKRHLVDGIDLPRVALEYKERWGDDYAKTDRTIKTYQHKALHKIARFESQTKHFWMTKSSNRHRARLITC